MLDLRWDVAKLRRANLLKVRRATGLEVPEAEDEEFTPTPTTSDEEELLLMEKRTARREQKDRKRLRTVLEPVPRRRSVLATKVVNYQAFFGATSQGNNELEVYVYKLHIRYSHEHLSLLGIVHNNSVV